MGFNVRKLHFLGNNVRKLHFLGRPMWKYPQPAHILFLVLFLCLGSNCRNLPYRGHTICQSTRSGGEDGACYRNWPRSGITGHCHVLARTLNMDVKYGIVFHSSVKGSLYESTALGGRSMNLKRLEK